MSSALLALGRRRTTAARRRDREREIIRATRELFDERGTIDAQIDDIAKRVGINKALIYRHFAGKEELFALTLVDYKAGPPGGAPCRHRHRPVDRDHRHPGDRRRPEGPRCDPDPALHLTNRRREPVTETRKVAVVAGNRIPFARQDKTYRHASNS